MNILSTPLELPCGAVLKNRIAKSAMSENMAAADHRANPKFATLYGRWARGGAGLLITGNIMIDRRALGEPGNIVLERDSDVSGLREWALAGTQGRTHLWAQLNHPGKQTPKFLSRNPVAPSAIALRPPLNRLFHTPRALLNEEILEIIRRFSDSAAIVKNSGFTGVQIHGAHGYLVSQFLSPLHNQRTDRWGGSLENRMRFAIEVYRSIRNATGPSFPIGIKLNSADFQHGGFSPEDSIEVARALSQEGMDLIEISGGTYEAPEMTGVRQKPSTREREAYFLDTCEKIRKQVKTPLMLTGGFRSLEGMRSALSSGACDVIGLARSIALEPEFPNRLLSHPTSAPPPISSVKLLTTGFPRLDRLFPIEVTWYAQQLHRIGSGREPKPGLSVIGSILSSLCSLGWHSLRRTRTRRG